MAEYIDKAKAVENIKKLMSSIPAKDNYAKGYDAAIGRALIAVRSELVADVQPAKRGKWFNLLGGARCETHCTRCYGKIMKDQNGAYIETLFCPHCGADMRGD